MHTEENYLIDVLSILHKNYINAANPYINRLAAIKAMQHPPPIIIPIERANAFVAGIDADEPPNVAHEKE